MDAFLEGAVMGIFACCATKLICAVWFGPERWVIGWAMCGRAEFAYLIAQMAKATSCLTKRSVQTAATSRAAAA